MKNFNKTHLLIYILIISLFLNCAIHFFHPSYKYYKQNITKLNEQLEDFKNQVVFTFVPALNSIATNISTEVSLSILSNNFAKISKQSKSETSIVSSDKKYLVQNDEIYQNEIIVKDYKYMIACGKEYIRLYGQVYTYGDFILGERITYIDKMLTKTKSYNFINAEIDQKKQNQ